VSRALALVAGTVVIAPAYPGTELGNARFVDYENSLHGFTIVYPEEWNVIDLGDAVNVVGNPEAPRPSAEPNSKPTSTGALERTGAGEAFADIESIEISFDVSRTFLTPIAFERHVRSLKPGGAWRATQFRGRAAFEILDGERRITFVMKDAKTLMRLSFPVEAATGLPPALVEKTVESFEFRR
jgi:hypothetical protein